jgi:hypothetical protein
MRCTTTVRDMPMRWPIRDASLCETRLWDGLREKYVYKRRAYEMAGPHSS